MDYKKAQEEFKRYMDLKEEVGAKVESYFDEAELDALFRLPWWQILICFIPMLAFIISVYLSSGFYNYLHSLFADSTNAFAIFLSAMLFLCGIMTLLDWSEKKRSRKDKMREQAIGRAEEKIHSFLQTRAQEEGIDIVKVCHLANEMAEDVGEKFDWILAVADEFPDTVAAPT